MAGRVETFCPAEKGDDVLYGDEGGDWLVFGGPGEDVLYGGDGNDQIDAVSDGERDVLYCGKRIDKYTADKIEHVSSDCEKMKGTLGIPID